MRGLRRDQPRLLVLRIDMVDDRARPDHDPIVVHQDRELGDRGHLVGDSLTLADMSVAVGANMALAIPEGRERYAGRRVLEWVHATLPEQYRRWL